MACPPIAGMLSRHGREADKGPGAQASGERARGATSREAGPAPPGRSRSRARESPAGPSSPGPAARPGREAPGCGGGCRTASSAPGAGKGLARVPSDAGTLRAQPGQQLPVAADPAVLAPGVGVIAGREVVEQLGVAEQPAAGVVPLDQVVAEDLVLGKGAPVAASNASTS